MINREIEEARAAADQVAHLEAVKQKAAQLPALEAAQQQRQQQEAAERHLQDTARRIEERLTAVEPKIKAWRERLAAVILEAQELIDELPLLENVIAGSAKEVAAAHRAVAEAGHPPGYFTDPYEIQARRQRQAIPDELVGASATLSALWRRAGGADPELAAFGDGTMELMETEIGKILRRAIERKTFVYTPSRADTFLRHF